MPITRALRSALCRALVAVVALVASAHAAVGGWTSVVNPPPAAISTMLLLGDGSVLAQQYYSNRWFRLRPDASGSYAAGTWSAAAAMRDTRLYYASTVLRDGRVFVGGGEYGTGGSTVEIYDPRTDAWSVVPGWSGDIGDSTAMTLADGRVMLLPRLVAGGSIWDPATGAWSPVAGKLDGDINDEESVVRLPDGSFLAVDVWRGAKAQRYLPGANAWVDGGTIPVGLVDSKSEIGPGLRLMDGRAWFIGGTGATAFYLPDQNAWQAGPSLPGGAKADDAPAAILPNGRVLCIGDQGGSGFAPPSSIVEFDPATGAYAAVPAPWSGFANHSAYEYRMLVLPTGQVLLSDGSGNVGVYTSPDGPADAWRPAVASLSDNGDGTTRLVGTQLNGLNDGAAYGDDAQMASNYPVVRLTGGGRTWYARTGNVSTFDIATGSRPVSADVSVAGIPDGAYALEAVANGIASAPVAVNVANGRIVQDAALTRIHLSVDNEYTELYVDGRALAPGPHANDWTVGDDYAVAGTVGTIAVHAINYEAGTNWAALIARIDEADGTTVVSDASWRVFVGTPGADAAGRAWYDPAYDDSAWSAPTVAGALGIPPWGSQPGLAALAGAQWIWAGDYVHGVSPVYLRKRVGAAPTTRIHLSVDNQYAELYVDGRALAVGPHADDWTVADDFVVAGNVGTVAVHAINFAAGTNPAGLIARIDEADGSTVVSDASWRVFVGTPGADAAGRAWYDPAYDDSAWSAPTVAGALGAAPWGSPAGLASVAGGQWIWPGDVMRGVSPVYLRKRVGVAAASVVRLAVDNRYDQLAINGAAVAAGPHDGDWSATDAFTVAGGVRSVALRAINDDAPTGWAGLLARIDQAGGGVVVSDASWRVYVPRQGEAPAQDALGRAWTDPDYDDSAWAVPTVQGAYGVGPWGTHAGSAGMDGSQWIWAGDVAHGVSPIYVRWSDTPRGIALAR